MSKTSIFHFIASAFVLTFLFLLFCFSTFRFSPIICPFYFLFFFVLFFIFFFLISFFLSFFLSYFLCCSFLVSFNFYNISFLLFVFTSHKILVVNAFMFYSQVLLDGLCSFVRELLFLVLESNFHAYCFYMTKFDLFETLNLFLHQN